jgi:integrase/recombinase XerC
LSGIERKVGSTYLGGGIPKPPRRNMSNRARSELFLAYERWGWDERGWARSTRERYLQRAKAADLWLRDNRLPPLVWAEEEAIRRYLFQTPPEAGNRNDIRTAMIGFFDFCIAQQWRVDNPARSLPRLPVPKPLPKALSIEEARRIVVVAGGLPARESALILLLLYAALRRDEARLLEWRNVDDGFVTVMGKGSKERSVPLHPHAAFALQRWRYESTDRGYVFTSPRRRGEPLSRTWMQLLIEEVKDATGIPGLTLHSLRHTAATRLLETGSNLREVQTFLGHASPQTTAIYTRIKSQSLREAADRLDFAGPVAVLGVAQAEEG